MRQKHIFRFILASALIVWLIAIGILILPTDNQLPELPTQVVMPVDTQPVDLTIAESIPTGVESTIEDILDLAEETTAGDTGASLSITEAQSPSELASESVDNQFTIQFHPDVSLAERNDYLNSIGATVQSELTALDTLVIEVDGNVNPRMSALVAFSEPVYYVVAAQDYSIPTSDTHFALQWNLEAIHAPDAWLALPEDAETVTVAVIDSGICANHPDLAGRIVEGYDFVEDDTQPQDELQHGCPIAGIIAATIDNQEGIAGIAPVAEIMPLRVLDGQGIGTYPDTAEAIIYATDNGASIINLSLGGFTPSAILESAVNYAVSQGVQVIAAAGNTGDTRVLYPAAYENVVAVGAINADGAISSFSSQGSQINALAPGENIVSLMIDGSYGIFNGTSFAAPHASAVAALEQVFGGRLVTGGLVVVTGHEAIPSAGEESPDNVSAYYEDNPRFAGIENVNYEPDLPFLTDFWVVELASGTNGIALAQSLGFISNGAFPNAPDTYIFRREGSAQNAELSAQTATALATAPQVLNFEQVYGQRVSPRQFSDPLYPDQWHLNNTGQQAGFVVGMDANVVPAWNAGHTGSGVLVAVVDDGVQYTHPDLSAQYNASASFDYVSNDTNPLPASSDDGHGTSVAGVATANDDTTCGVGAAFDASLAALRLYGADGDAVVDASLANLWAHDTSIDIYNNSWGLDITNSGLWTNSFATMLNEVTNGRGGAGTIYVHAAGNAGRITTDGSGNPLGIDVNSSPLTSTRYTIPVGALTPSGFRADYGSFGDALFISASSSTHAFSGTFYGTTTTDLLGSAGYETGNCTDEFNGTSSASPLVAGVIALMLDANPNLTWRDVRHILVETAERVDLNDTDFYSDWSLNDGGYYFSRAYGFGNIDAGAATAATSTWTTVPAEVSDTGGVVNVNQAIPAGSSLSANTIVMDEIRIEQVEVRFNATHPYRGDIFLLLESPRGTISPILASNQFDSSDNYVNQVVLSNRFWGESSAGTWTLYATDTFAALDNGTLTDFEVIVHGYYNNNHPDHPVAVTNPSLNSFDNRGASQGFTDPVTTCGTFGRTLWYTYTASGVEDLRITLEQNSGSASPALAVFSGTPGAFSEIACSTGSPTGLNVHLPGAGTYYIMAGVSVQSPLSDNWVFRRASLLEQLS